MTLRAGVRAQLGRGRSPFASPDAAREAASAGAKLDRPRAPPRRSAPSAFWAGGPGRLPATAPPGLPADTALAPPRAQRDSPAATRTPSDGAGRWRPAAAIGPRVPPAPGLPLCALRGESPPAAGPSYQSG